VIAEIHARVVATAHQNQVVRGRPLRSDTTVVETTIHYPPDRSLLGAEVWVLTRTMKHNTQIADRA
jgi:IS5 family transposase